ncbi:DNA-binding XRE family transcriptional regulator [Pseudomonas baetica]|jgi:transcriptional regulator with XRE-family HTH domain|uniref:DNA-binding XRE family transcriptional regulator n=1 Tax=Pseudomonas baetica TaxID=674054 RepID=A0ABX4Q4Q6_9PSED|nr:MULTISPECIES: helix-turn-helix transcriptional regulator [Pseudomonas]MBV4509538.1 helix-turn-helix domain-containing protein [Pseudomonas sp. SWRI22]MDA7013309.1 helix-turn-helix transcriptional regulator [Pseudomonas cerasi]PKA71727.1 DNA-binding XRE family transcriptional regulator [Pseudomonas baetica]PTC20201.1 transcriptional regulator [Pseudomonas baetica]
MGSVFSNRLKEARKAAGWSQERLGQEAGFEPASASARMNQYERGVHTPSPTAAKQIADALGLPLAFFYADDEEARLLALFNSLGHEQRREALEAIAALAERSATQK